MRQALSPPEVALWSQLKGRKLSGIAFRRQHPVGPYSLDFYCQAAPSLLPQDIFTPRLTASDVLSDLEAATATILAQVRRRAPLSHFMTGRPSTVEPWSHP
jgi:hypothetical protein